MLKFSDVSNSYIVQKKKYVLKLKIDIRHWIRLPSADEPF